MPDLPPGSRVVFALAFVGAQIALVATADRRPEGAFGFRMFSESSELEVHLGDTRPRRGGVDQECRMSFRMPGMKTLHVEAVAEDIHAALLEAADKLKGAVKKGVAKRRTPARTTARKPA